MGSVRPYFDAPEVEVPVRWYRCQPSAVPLPWFSAFGDSWYRNNQHFRPFIGHTHKFEASFRGNVNGNMGLAPCGDEEAWQNGVSLFDPPDPCGCEREPVIPVMEVPAGIIDGVNRIFLCSQIPLSDQALLVFVNGVKQKLNVNYTLSTQTIFFTPSSTPRVDANVEVQYWVST